MSDTGNNSFIEKLSYDIKAYNKLNVGCGNNFKAGWLNIGLLNKKEFPYGSIVNKNNIAVLNYDLNQKLPIEKNTIEYIFTSHFIEHLPFYKAKNFLKDMFSYLKNNGVIRISCPDLELWIKKYYENDMDFFKKYNRIFNRFYNEEDFQTKGLIMMNQIHGWGHRWAYDFESLKIILAGIGFSEIKKVGQYESLIPDIAELESYKDDPLCPDLSEGRSLESMFVEAVKKEEVI